MKFTLEDSVLYDWGIEVEPGDFKILHNDEIYEVDYFYNLGDWFEPTYSIMLEVDLPSDNLILLVLSIGDLVTVIAKEVYAVECDDFYKIKTVTYSDFKITDITYNTIKGKVQIVCEGFTDNIDIK